MKETQESNRKKQINGLNVGSKSLQSPSLSTVLTKPHSNSKTVKTIIIKSEKDFKPKIIVSPSGNSQSKNKDKVLLRDNNNNYTPKNQVVKVYTVNNNNTSNNSNIDVSKKKATLPIINSNKKSSFSNIATNFIDESLTSLDWLIDLDITTLTNYPLQSSSSSRMLCKPAYSYPEMIFMAMQDSPHNQITVSGIYSWIKNKFPYFRNKDKNSWQNSVRHCLSMNQCFKQISGLKDSSGKRFWKLCPEYLHRKKPQDKAALKNLFMSQLPMNAPKEKKFCTVKKFRKKRSQNDDDSDDIYEPYKRQSKQRWQQDSVSSSPVSSNDDCCMLDGVVDNFDHNQFSLDAPLDLNDCNFIDAQENNNENLFNLLSPQNSIFSDQQQHYTQNDSNICNQVEHSNYSQHENSIFYSLSNKPEEVVVNGNIFWSDPEVEMAVASLADNYLTL